MKKAYFIVVVVSLLAIFLACQSLQNPVDSPVLKNDQFPDARTQTYVGKDGCTIGYWKNHLEDWPDGYDPLSTLVGDVFDVPSGVDYSHLANDPLFDALKYEGGPGTLGAAQIMLRQSVAALLNAAHPAVDYPQSVEMVKGYVNFRLSTDDRDQMLWLADIYDGWNNENCPFDAEVFVSEAL